MSLVGNLEDLGLGDILQIVSLSRKSGILSLSSRNREGKLVFLNGQVIRATSSVYRENLGHLLLRKSLVDLACLKEALSIQKGMPDAPRLGVILAEQFSVPSEQIEQAIKEQVEKIVYSFFGWLEGTFSFELGDQGELASTSLNPLQFMLDQGLNPQWLAMEGSRILDEKRHRGEPTEEEPLEPEVDLDHLLEGLAGERGDQLPQAPAEKVPILEPDPDPPSSGRLVLVVDDDELTRQGLNKALRERGFAVKCFKDGKSFIQAAEEQLHKGENPCLLIDLIMPRMDGSGILGGLELLDIIGRSYQDLDVYILTDHPNQDAENRVRELGFPDVLTKPKKDALREALGQRALLTLAATIAARLVGAEPQPLEASGLHHFGRELLAEMGEVEDTGKTAKGPESPGLHLLKGMLQELNDPALGGGIILLVLRFASELMNRAVIFLVKETEVVGLGQFGIQLDGESADIRIRQMRFPRQAPSILTDAINGMEPVRARPSANEWDRYLVNQLGGITPQEAFLGPILSEGKVVALIYGDNAPDMNPVGDTESFEVFLSQAGLAMEKALVERRIQSRTAVH
jgi:CheY-like chemotaxis protein